MAVLVTAEVRGQTEQGYAGMRGMLQSVLKAAPGFVLHAAYPVDGGWRIIEIWQSKADADAFFARHVAPKPS